MAGRPKRKARLLAAGQTDMLTKFDGARTPERVAAQGQTKKPRTERAVPKRGNAMNVTADGVALHTSKRTVSAEPDDEGVDNSAAMIAAMVDDQSGALKELLGLAIQHNIEVMRMPLPENWDKNFGPILRVKQQIAANTLTAFTRVNDGVLRGQGRDKFAELLEEVRAEVANGLQIDLGDQPFQPGRSMVSESPGFQGSPGTASDVSEDIGPLADVASVVADGDDDVIDADEGLGDASVASVWVADEDEAALFA